MLKSPIEISDYIRKKIKPLITEFGWYFRASACLRDMTSLSCVIFTNPQSKLELIKSTLSEYNKEDYNYSNTIRALIEREAKIEYDDIISIDNSPFAWPNNLINKIEFQKQDITVFSVIMKDGRPYNFSVNRDSYFFDLPTSYTYEDIIELKNGIIFTKTEKEMNYYSLRKSLKNEINRDELNEWRKEKYYKWYNDKPHFYCYIRNLPKYYELV